MILTSDIQAPKLNQMKTFALALFTCFVGITTHAQNIVINEFQPETNTVEIKNLGTTSINVGSFILCSFPVYTTLSNMTIVSGDLMLDQNEIVVLSGHSMNVADDELGLYLLNAFTNPAAMVDYVEWGSTGHFRSSVAVSAGIWNTGEFLNFFPLTGETYMWDGGGDAPANWFTDPDTFGAENVPPVVLGCTYAAASNYNPNANDDDGSCVFPGPGCLGDLNNDDMVNAGDLLDFLSAFGTICTE